MTDTTAPEATDSAPAPKRAAKKASGLQGMLLADLKAMAGAMNIPGANAMKKAQLVEAIKAAGTEVKRPSRREDTAREGALREDRADADAGAAAEKSSAGEKSAQAEPAERAGGRPSDERRVDGGADQQQSRRQGDVVQSAQQPKQSEGKAKAKQNEGQKNEGQKNEAKQGSRQGEGNQSGNQGGKQNGGQSRNDAKDEPRPEGEADGDDEGRAGRRRRRGRDRQRPGAPGQRNEPDTTILEDDVLVPAAGILDVLDNYAFVRTSGYLPGVDDVYLSLSMVRKHGLRRGDAVAGQVRQPREGERKEKFNPMVRIDSVNGGEPEAARTRPEFADLTPLHPAERLRLETSASDVIGRVIDIVAPIGKGQRGLIVAPSRSGKTTILRSIATSVTANNPECHLMVVLVDERPEEVTDFARTVKGEVIASTFDRPAADHVIVAELAIERAKRLVELGHDVVVLLDGLTRLGRAYNLAATPSGRVLGGGVDASAVYPPKRFFGAARNVEDGGSLTILATAVVESGSETDEVFFEEIQGAGNHELRLRRDFADQRMFPAIDPLQSGTRHEDVLLSPDEAAIVARLRRSWADQGAEEAHRSLVRGLEGSRTNVEFLTRAQSS
ncbi:transcription termination factor Rho [Nocardioides sp. R-C-SC26]|uniref:transcription termination factor Rho n=1 Tax=Nocardioides sp. R-C-SC26 TaxID=2870414 RepID=UPI001E44ABC4|nr:transcription termination factor Rho [Nocardioides sp. R-C-SC26]